MYNYNDKHPAKFSIGSRVSGVQTECTMHVKIGAYTNSVDRKMKLDQTSFLGKITGPFSPPNPRSASRRLVLITVRHNIPPDGYYYHDGRDATKSIFNYYTGPSAGAAATRSCETMFVPVASRSHA